MGKCFTPMVLQTFPPLHVSKSKGTMSHTIATMGCLACQIQKIIGRPNTTAFIKIVEDNLLPNFPVTRNDTLAAEEF